jgi:SAM-dependent methyltransferase
MRGQRARTLGQLLVPLEADYRVPLRRAPDLRAACIDVYGPDGEPSLVSLRELIGMVGAFEWRRRGIEIAAVGGRIHPHYGVFAPLRGEYVDLVHTAPLPVTDPREHVAFDIGTGTGVLAAVLARRGFGRIVATDLEPRALACARANLEALGLTPTVEVVSADLFPAGRASLVVFNPPWLPARPSSRLEAALYDPGGELLARFLRALPAHLEPGGEAWLVLSDLAEHLGLRTRAALLAEFAACGLEAIDCTELPPRHPRARDVRDPLHAARAAERIALWRLRRIEACGSPCPDPSTLY